MISPPGAQLRPPSPEMCTMQARLSPRTSLPTRASRPFFGLTAIDGEVWERTGLGLAVTWTAPVTNDRPCPPGRCTAIVSSIAARLSEQTPCSRRAWRTYVIRPYQWNAGRLSIRRTAQPRSRNGSIN